MNKKDWIVEEVLLSTDAKKFGEDNVQYPYHVRGKNLCHTPAEEFSWGLPNRFWDNPRYDLTNVRVDQRGKVVVAVAAVR